MAFVVTVTSLNEITSSLVVFACHWIWVCAGSAISSAKSKSLSWSTREHWIVPWYMFLTSYSIVGNEVPQDISMQAIKGFLLVDEIYAAWRPPFKRLLNDYVQNSYLICWWAVDLVGLRPTWFSRNILSTASLIRSRIIRFKIFPEVASSIIPLLHKLTRIPTLYCDCTYSCSQIFIRRTHAPWGTNQLSILQQWCYQVLLICCSLGIWLLFQLQSWLEVHNLYQVLGLLVTVSEVPLEEAYWGAIKSALSLQCLVPHYGYGRSIITALLWRDRISPFESILPLQSQRG